MSEKRNPISFKEQTSHVVEKAAGELYQEYCKAVGGKAFNGDTLPNWTEFYADPNKSLQSNAWLAVARLALSF